MGCGTFVILPLAAARPMNASVDELRDAIGNIQLGKSMERSSTFDRVPLLASATLQGSLGLTNHCALLSKHGSRQSEAVEARLHWGRALKEET